MQLVVGRIGRPHGVRGAVTVEVRTDEPELRFAPGAVLVTDPADRGPVEVLDAHDHSGRLVLTLAGVDDRAAAEALRDTLLVVDADALPPLADPEEFRHADLVGLRAEDPAGTPLGTVTAVQQGAAAELLVLTDPVGADHLVPFVHALVPVVDLAGRRVVLDLPPGLLEL